MIITGNGEVLGGYVRYGNDAAIVSFGVVSKGDTLQYDGEPRTQDGRWVSWYGKDGNNFPNEIVRLLTANNINPNILDTKRDFIVGNGICLYKNEYADGKRQTVLLDPQQHVEIVSWLHNSDFNHEVSKATKDLLWFGNCFFELIFDKGKRAHSFRHIDATTVRAQVKNPKSGRVENYFVSDNWARPTYDEKDPHAKKEGNNVEIIAAYDAETPMNGYPKCVMHIKDYVPAYPYYSLPSWYGALNWIKLANEIPLWHFRGIQNGYAIRWHIQVPESYFDKFDPQKRNQAKEDLITAMNSWLRGSENAGKAFVSFVAKHSTEADQFKITPLDAELNDEAFTALFEQSNMAMTSAHGLHPDLAAIQTQGKLSSGSELRNAYLIHLALHTPHIRRMLLRVLELVRNLNGWDPTVQFGFENIEVTKLDENPTAQQSVIAQ